MTPAEQDALAAHLVAQDHTIEADEDPGVVDLRRREGAAQVGEGHVEGGVWYSAAVVVLWSTRSR